MSILQRLSISQKFIILGIMALLMMALPTGLYLKQTGAEIDTAQLEARGSAPVIALQGGGCQREGQRQFLPNSVAMG